MSNCGFNNNNYNNGRNNRTFLRHIEDFVGENVIVFTESGGASGCGFEGILLAVNGDYIRLATNLNGASPANPLSETICGDFEDDERYEDGVFRATGCGRGRRDRDRDRCCRTKLGSVCDIPVDKIVSFCHNAV